MTTISAGSIRSLITYGLCTAFAVTVGYTLTNVGLDPTYSNLFALLLLGALVLSPIFIKWHYPIMIFSLCSPIWIFFLKGSPPIWELMVVISLGLAIVERAVQRKNQWLSAPSVTLSLVFTALMMIITAKLTGGFGFHTLGNQVGGGKKYLSLTLGILTYFALISRKIPENRRFFYLGLYILSGLPSFIGDIGPVLPSPLNYINVLVPPTISSGQQFELGTTRLGSMGATAGVITTFLLARYGLKNILRGKHSWWRVPLFLFSISCCMLGGFRNVIFTFTLISILMFFMEGLHRTWLLPFFLMIGLCGVCLIVPLSRHLPYTFQRSLSFLPLDIDPDAKADAEGSSEWRFRMWHDLWPQVPQYLLRGKGYALTLEDFEMLEGGSLANGAEAKMDASEDALAVSGDYHNGPLSTLIPFGLWGGITFLWFMLAGLRVLYRNYKYGDPKLRVANTFFLAQYIAHMALYFFIFGAYSDDLFEFAKTIGFSMALNGGVMGPQKARQKNRSALPARPDPRLQPGFQPA